MGARLPRSRGNPRPGGAPLDWARYGDDALAAAEWLAGRAGDGTPLVAFGHSMGGATLLMAAERSPELFGSLVLYEPIVFPPPGSADEATGGGRSGPAARRQGRVDGGRTFDSYAAALANYASKPPMSAFAPSALEAYVRGGLRPVDPADPDGPVELCCSPETEAATFEGGGAHDTWDRLGHIAVPTMVLGGALDAPPPRLVQPIAARLPNGRSQLHPELDHFAPFSDPARRPTSSLPPWPPPTGPPDPPRPEPPARPHPPGRTNISTRESANWAEATGWIACPARWSAPEAGRGRGRRRVPCPRCPTGAYRPTRGSGRVSCGIRN